MNKPFLFDFSEEIWNTTYKNNLETSVLNHPDKKVEDTWLRIATDLASVESNSQKWIPEFYKCMEDFKMLPGGRISSNAGTGLKGVTYLNCFAGGAEGYDIDSLESILNTVKQAAITLKSEGGWGFCANFMRPRGSFINGVGIDAPGSIEMLNLWDTTSQLITKGNNKKNKKGKEKIRKGAMMATLSVEHPDIIEFIEAKRVPGVLTKFNMSVLVSDKFIDAVKNSLKWELWFPDTTFEKYKSEWDGDFKEWEQKQYPKIIYKIFENANELWDIIMSSSFHRNEPGILFVDRINNLNNLHRIEKILATNPCGEAPLPINGACLLGNINLTQFIKDNDWDYNKLEIYIPALVRMLDNVCDKTLVPIKEQEINIKNKRRMGIGYVGYGSALYLLKKRYGSKEALQLTEQLCSFVTNKIYQASALIAKEKGSYPLFNLDEFTSSNFVKQALTEDTINLVKLYGIRNSHLTSVQPTGNSSIYANNISGGLEPVFLHNYKRTSIVAAPEGLIVPKIDWVTQTSPDDNWTPVKEGDETLFKTQFNETIYKIDKNRGLTKETLIEDYGVYQLKLMNQWDSKAEWAVTTETLTIDDHIDTMQIFAKYCDAAISKTINISSSCPYEDFKKVYMKLYDSKVIKGGTTYRAGTMSSVLSSTVNVESKSKIIKTKAPKRPVELECDVHRLTVNKQNWIVFVGLLENEPYELFAGLVDAVDISKKIIKGKLIKIAQNKYSFQTDDIIINDVVKIFNNPTEGAITRLVSTSLRHGVDTRFLTTQLFKTDDQLNTFAKALARVLKKYIAEGTKLDDQSCPVCKSKDLIKSEGCNKCLGCGYSGCS